MGGEGERVSTRPPGPHLQTKASKYLTVAGCDYVEFNHHHLTSCPVTSDVYFAHVQLKAKLINGRNKGQARSDSVYLTYEDFSQNPVTAEFMADSQDVILCAQEAMLTS